MEVAAPGSLFLTPPALARGQTDQRARAWQKHHTSVCRVNRVKWDVVIDGQGEAAAVGGSPVQEDAQVTLAVRPIGGVQALDQ